MSDDKSYEELPPEDEVDDPAFPPEGRDEGDEPKDDEGEGVGDTPVDDEPEAYDEDFVDVDIEALKEGIAEEQADTATPQSDPEGQEPLPTISDIEFIEDYAGEIRNLSNVELKLQIVSDDLSKLPKSVVGAILAPRLDHLELNRVSIEFDVWIAQNQPKRLEAIRDDKSLVSQYTVVQLTPDVKFVATKAEARAREYLEQCDILLRKGSGYTLFDDQESKWTNMPILGDSHGAIHKVTPKSRKSDPIMAIRNELGIGYYEGGVLWSSGFRIQLKASGKLEDVTFDEQAAALIREEALESLGFSLSATSVTINRLLIPFILDHVNNTQVGVTRPDELMRLIKITDLETLALQMASVIWPDGYKLSRPCLSSHGGCGHVHHQHLFLRRMLVARTNRLSQKQYAQVMSRTRLTLDQVLEYQKNLRPEVSRYIKIHDTIWLRLAVPSLARYLRTAGTWIEKISIAAKEVIATNSMEASRRNFMERANTAASLMMHVHWIDAVVEPDDSTEEGVRVLVERPAETGDDEDILGEFDRKIDELVEDLSGDGDRTKLIVDELERFIDAMTMSVPVIDKTHCPSCKRPYKDEVEDTAHNDVVQISAVDLFFTLLHHRTQPAG